MFREPPPRFADPRPRFPLALAALAALAAVTSACGPGEPVARLEVEPAEVVLEYPGTAELEAAWTPSAPLERPIVFVHLLGGDGELLRTFDLPFPGEWTPGERAVVPVRLWQSALAPPLPPGDYELTMGVVDAGGERPPLETAGREVDDGEYTVARVDVPPPPVGGPMLRLDESWEPPAGDADRQTPGSRWLRGAGALEVGDAAGPLDLVLTLRLPAPDETPMALVPDEGAPEPPAVTIAPGCGGEPVRLTEWGIHEVELALRPAPGERSCAISIDPGYVYLDPQSLRRISVELRRVVWSPGPAEPAAPDEVPGGGGDPGAPAAATP